MNLQEQLEKDTARYQSFFEQLDKEGRLNDRLPNDGMVNDATVEYNDLERFKKRLDDPEFLSFMS